MSYIIGDIRGKRERKIEDFREDVLLVFYCIGIFCIVRNY